jgi:glycosyltransferase involved in cell wall biosynthesis
MTPVSVVVITRNEEANLPRCLSSVSWVDEIVVVDSGSVDHTTEIAEAHRARVHHYDWRGYGAAKQYGVDQTANDWVLSLDADEALSEPLSAEIRRALDRGDGPVGYDMPRLTNFLGRWIRHCGWYPDRVVRLFRKSKGHFDGAFIHERVVLDGQLGHLQAELLHYSYPNLETYFEKFNRYTTMGAEQAHRKGRRTSWFDLMVRPPVSFLKHYVTKQGFRDGLEGFTISVLSSAAVLAKYAKLRHLVNQEDEED